MPNPRNSQRLLIVAGIFLVMLLAACRDQEDRPKPIVERPQQKVTDAAMTAEALTNAPPTAGPSPTPTITSTPYITPTPFPDADPNMVVAKIGDREVTLAEFQARVRYERWLPFYSIARDIPEVGMRLLDLTRPENSMTISLLYTLNDDPHGLGTQVMNTIVTEQIILREAGRLDMEIEETIFDGRLAARLDLTLGENGVRPDNWDEEYTRFIADLELYTGMSEDQFLEHIRAITYYSQLGEVIRKQAGVPEGQITSEAVIQDIVMTSREDALAVIDRLNNGEPMSDIAFDYGIPTSGGQASRTIDRATEGLTDDLKDAIFAAQENQVIGPFVTNSGWYVAKVISFKLDIPSPSDIDAYQREAFRNWILERMDNPEYTVQYDIWENFIPTDPLPQDISPFLKSENFILPEDPFPSDEPTPTPLPIGESPR